MSHNWLHTSVLIENMTVQIMLYFLWGNVLCAGSLSFSAICRQARPAVLVAVIWVIMSGFGANLVLTQFIEQGPSVAATILQIIPSMGLFRGKPLIANLPTGGLGKWVTTFIQFPYITA